MEGFRLDIVIFGATGFTGKVAVLQMMRLKGVRRFTWGVAGRDATKLKQLLADTSRKTGDFLSIKPQTKAIKAIS